METEISLPGVFSMYRHVCATLVLLHTGFLLAADEPPKSLDPRLKIELFAEHPQIVTPTGLDVDVRGRVFAIENNTHFPPEGYKGHPTDRILVMSDSDGDGKADKITVFADGLKFSMSVVVRPIWFPVPAAENTPQPKQSVYIATRQEIFLFHDDDGDDVADRKESIVKLETKGNYPHNGLAGFAIDALGWMYFGFGENLGADYKIIGSDGTTLGGGGEGGNIYRCRLDGSKLSQIATGFWNPHANAFDAFGRLFSVDNDPDSRPPCRLLHVIPGGDYGYRFRNGRKGLHPFTSWDGEIPGTLPMVAGTGEAPSGILAYESDGLPSEYLGNLLVTSWGDHRIDRFRLQSKGTSFTSLAEPVVTGGENFRPVGLATAPDGSLFCTDWVLRDYKLHGHGRIWRIAPAEKRTSPVIDLAGLRTAAPDELVKFLSSDRRDVRRMAAQILGKQPDAKSVIPRITGEESKARAELEALWAVQEIPGSDPSVSFAIFDADDPVEAWSATLPGLSSFFVGARLKSERNRITNRAFAELMEDRRENLRVFAPAILPLFADNPLLTPQREESIRLSMSVNDPFVFATAVTAIARIFKQEDFGKYLIPGSTHAVKGSSARLRQALLLAARKQTPKDDRWVRIALVDADPDVRRLAVQWIAEEKFTSLKPRVEEVFHQKGVTSELFLATLAALEMLDGKNPADFDKTPAEQYVIPLLKDDKRPAAVRAQALRLVSPTDKALDAPLFASLLKSDYEPLRVEAVRSLQAATPAVSGELLRSLVADESLDLPLRAEAMVGLANVAKSEPVGGSSRQILKKFLNNSSPVPLRLEALRSARSLIAEDAEIRDAVLELAKTIVLLQDGALATSLGDQVALAFQDAKLDAPQQLKLNTSPKPKDRQEWMAELNRGREVDPAAGRRVFFHPNGPGCFKCHTIDGRGGHVGPDLSRAVGTMNRIQLIQSILEPSREIAPQYVSWTFALHDGKVVTGMIVHENEGHTIVGNSEGKTIDLKTADIAERVPQRVSVMPDKLTDRMTLQELRDLIAFLDAQR
jgi:putative membrane-bound dehydrogenase-like protein